MLGVTVVVFVASVQACSSRISQGTQGAQSNGDRGGEPQASTDGLASGLRPGLKLFYVSGGVAQPVWTVDSVTHDVVVGERRGCARIVMRTRPDQGVPEVRVVCLGGDTLYAWNATAKELRVQRPVGPAMSFEFRQGNGNVVRYVTSDAGRAAVSGRSFGFVHTSVLTHDSTGRLVRRLRERYAIALGTALDGVFEVPDSTAAGGWREIQRFALTRLE
jgi:hypothetical protein